jgi:hypothetical protein
MLRPAGRFNFPEGALLNRAGTPSAKVYGVGRRMASFAGGMGVSFQVRNPKDGPLPYRPHLQYSGLREQAQERSIIDATLRCGAAAIMMLHFGAVP